MWAGGRTFWIDRFLQVVLIIAGPLWKTMSDLILVLLLVVLLVCLIVTIGGFLLYSGLLADVTIKTGPPPIRNVTIAYKFKEGAYKDCGAAFTESCSIEPKLSSIGVFYDDPKQVRPQDLAPVSTKLHSTESVAYLNLTSRYNNTQTQCTLFRDKMLQSVRYVQFVRGKVLMDCILFSEVLLCCVCGTLVIRPWRYEM